VNEPVNGRRYDNSRRQAQVRRTRADVVAAARELFVHRGYVATAVEAVAEASGTAPATVYRLFGSKRAVLEGVLEVSFVGDDEPVALHERPAVAAAFAAGDERELLAAFAQICRELLERSAPVQQVLRDAAVVDPELVPLLEQVRNQRLEGQSRVARELASRGVLVDDLDEAAATDVVYALMSPDVYGVLTGERGWSADRYERWLAGSLCRLLLRPGRRGEFTESGHT
jgi:AcrR family transcriptional regulator